MPVANSVPSKMDHYLTEDEPILKRDAEGFQEHVIKGQRFLLPNRYMPIAKLGSGSYGLVISARDMETNQKVAIKRCGNIFKHTEDGKRVLREVKMMRMLDHRNILPVVDFFVSESNFDDVYIITPCLETDLSQLIKSYKMADQHIKYIMYQILRGLKYIHTANMLHRDLKPANVLVNFDCHVKLCDFGLARGYDPNVKQDMTSYIVTRWYRAPELLLNNTNYGPAIDIWAAGCVFAEMLMGHALFTGESSTDQLKVICDTIPVADVKDLWWVQNAKSKAQLMQMKRDIPAPGRDLKTLTSKKFNDPLALDMLQKMLQFNPHNRWAADQLLSHPYLNGIRSGRHHEPSKLRFKWRYDSVTNLTQDKLRQLFQQELLSFHPESKFLPPNMRPSSPVSYPVAREDDC